MQKQNKESLQTITVKTLLAVLLFAGMGTIIIGGGYIIGEYGKISNNQTNNKIWNSIYKCSEEYPEFCDRSCNIDSDCYPTCTYNVGCLRSGESQVGASAIRCEVAPFSCKCEDNTCKIVEYEDKMKLSQSAEILGVQYPLEIVEVIFYSDGGTTGVIAKDANNKDFVFCLDGRMQINEIGKKIEPYHIYLKAGYPTDSNSQKISIAGEEEKALLNILQDWVNKQISEEEQIRLLNIRTVVGSSEKEFKIYRILKIIEEFEDRNKIDKKPDTSDWQTYRNEELGFEITLTDIWDGYKTTAESDVARTYIKFQIPTEDISYGDRSGYAIPFIISVYPILEWQKIQQDGGPKPKYIAQNDINVFAYSTWQDPPLDLLGKDIGFNQILSTFKFIEK